MKIIKKIGALLIIILMTTIASTSLSYAAHDTNGKWLGLYNKSNERPTGFYTMGTSNAQTKPIIKIVEYQSEQGTPDMTKSNQAIYCLKDGIGFGSQGSSGTIVKYTEHFDLRDPDSITPTDVYKQNLPTGESYNKLMWILDNMCITENEESVNTLLKNAGAEDLKTEITDSAELKDVIEIIQQTAIWYITNPDGEFHPSDNATFSVSKTNGGMDSENLGDKYGLDESDSPVDNLYDYFINGMQNQGQYNYSSASSAPLSFNKTGAKVTVSNGKFLIGPYTLTINNNNYSSFSAKVLNGQNNINNVDIVKSDSTPYEGADTTAKILKANGEAFYISLPTTTSVASINLQISAKTATTKLEYWSTGASQVQNSQPVVIIDKVNEDINFTDTQNLEKPKFDLALRKFISQINGQNVTPSREPVITQDNLRALAQNDANSTFDNGTTTKKTHTKNAISVNTNNKIVYTIRVYNEGEIDGYADEITDYLPAGLELVPVGESDINTTYGWEKDSSNDRIIKTKYLSKDRDETGNLIKAFDKNPEGPYTISYKDVKVECIVAATTNSTDTHLKNVAEITKASNTADVTDRDSVTGNLDDGKINNYAPGTSTQGKGYEDDDDYEDLVLPGRYFDLALRKFITAVNDTELSTNGVYDRAPVVDTTPLLNGSTTASYKHLKAPVSVATGDIVTYTIRVYNEGQVDGYVDEIVDHLPPELEFLPDDAINQKYLWTIDSADKTQRTIKTSYLSKNRDEDNVINAFDQTGTTLDYKEVQIKCKVVPTAESLKKITNIAEITASSNDAGLTDRDNQRTATLPQDSALPDYKGKDTNPDDLSDKDEYYEGQEDDDDFEKLILEKFDLALRKFITGVNNEEITTRVPRVDTTKYGTIVDGKEITDMEYTHPKDPVKVANNDIVIYTIRIYNEGTKSGYASEIKDDLPEGLEYIIDNEINQKYGWVLYDAEGNVTEDVSKAVEIRTTYLSKENETEAGEYLLKAFNPEEMETPDYRDVQIAFRVTEPNTSDRILTNKAEISKDTDENGEDVDDIDSTPDEWIDEDDDQDVEHVYVKYFDLALRKWVSQVILIEDGVQKEMDTGHYAEQDPEPAVKVELNKKRIENTVVKFRYQIRITNEGEIEGYATEISDYIPEGLTFNQADNPKWREENGKIVTDQLKDTLLQPGEQVTIDVVLTWINDENNLDLKTNVAEISEDDNPSDSPDIDSTPNNKKPGEDDIDDAPVILTIVTGIAQRYIFLIAGTILLIGIGALTIKKYVV